MSYPTPTATEAVPGDVARHAAAAGLGQFLQVFTPKKRSWFLLIFLALIGLATCWMLLGFWMFWEIWKTPNVNRAQAARRVYLFEQGFVVVDKPGAVQLFRFDAISTVFQKIVSRQSYGIEVAKEYVYTITSSDGRTIKLNQFWNGIGELGGYINDQVSRALLPAAVAAIERGQGVQFGDITLSATTVAGPRKQVTWDQVSKIAIDGGVVRVDVAGKFLSLSSMEAGKVPNLPLFLRLADRLHANAGR